ncbi:hypothetical protein ScPMuIL_014732 [Solemya velum]
MNTKVPTAKKSVGFYNVMATYTSLHSGIDGTGTYKQSTPAQVDTDYTAPMNCSTSGASYNQTTNPKNDSGTKSSPREVSFGPRFSNREEDKERRKRFLTAKFGKHQMMLVRKRLAVEEWIYDGLRKLYNCESDDDDHDVELDLDEVLNYDTDSEKREYITAQLVDVPKLSEEVDTFVEELLRRAKTL